MGVFIPLMVPWHAFHSCFDPLGSKQERGASGEELCGGPEGRQRHRRSRAPEGNALGAVPKSGEK